MNDNDLSISIDKGNQSLDVWDFIEGGKKE